LTTSRILRLHMTEFDTWPMEEIATLLRRGGIIAYPTETIYGLGVDAFNRDAVDRLFRMKSRPPGKPLSILVKDIPMLDRVVSRISPLARRIMEGYWPGGVTIILPASERIPPALTGGTVGIGVRISRHPFVRRLFDFFDSPLTSTSANISGGRSLMEPEDILRTFGSQIDLVVEMSEFMDGVSSTVIDATGTEPKIVRKGAIDVEGLECL
jgi:L-threonylcarbamoyladenylate synthase